jgi:hypothetical protein
MLGMASSGNVECGQAMRWVMLGTQSFANVFLDILAVAKSSSAAVTTNNVHGRKVQAASQPSQPPQPILPPVAKLSIAIVATSAVARLSIATVATGQLFGR